MKTLGILFVSVFLIISLWVGAIVFVMSRGKESPAPAGIYSQQVSDTSDGIKGGVLAQGIITGIATAVFLGLWSEGSKRLKDWRLEKRIRTSVELFGIGGGIKGISVTIYNKSEIKISVRGVAVVGEDAVYILSPENEISNAWSDVDLKVGDEYSEIQVGTIFRNKDQFDYPDVPPHSSRQFCLHVDVIRGCKPQGITSIIEFPLSVGGTKIIRVNSGHRENEALLFTVKDMIRQIDEGHIARARAMFNLPPMRELRKNE